MGRKTRSKASQEVLEVEAPSIFDVMEDRVPKIYEFPPEHEIKKLDSVIPQLIDVTEERTILVFGPSKAGKTRLTAWEASAVASRLGGKLLYIVLEKNLGRGDLSAILSACAYHGVKCEIREYYNHRFFRSDLKDMKRRLEKYVRLDPEMRSRKEVPDMPRVVVLDSLTATLEEMLDFESHSMIESGAATFVQKVSLPIEEYAANLRLIMREEWLNGVAFIISHSSATRGVQYIPGLPIYDKPRFLTKAEYSIDAEIYLGTPDKLPDALKTCKATRSSKIHRPVIVAKARHSAAAVGNACAIRFEAIKREAEGTIYREPMNGGIITVYAPGKGKKFTATALKPVIECGPKNIFRGE